MTKEILKLTATLLGLDDVITYLSDNETSTPSQETQNKINELLAYLNYVTREVTKEYYPLSHSEIVFSDDQCQIHFNKLSYKAISIKHIKNEYGLNVTFNLYPEFIKVGVPNKAYEIKYNFVPENITHIDQQLNLPIGLDYFVLCYGVASEYALAKLLYNEAEMWESKFKNSLENIKSRIGERRFFARRLK